MYHSITFGEKNTWDDWHLIPKSRPEVNPPAVKTNYIEIPGGDGVLDLTTALAGRPLFKNRTGTFDFYTDASFKNWTVLYSEILAYLQGRKLRMVLEDDPTYYYEGRFTVNNPTADPNYTMLSITYDVGPYKKDIANTLSEWLWDDFNFEAGVIRYYKDLQISGSTLVRVVGAMMPTTILIYASNASMTVTFQGVTYNLVRGTNAIADIVIVDGENHLTFTGTGIVSIEYVGRRL